MTCPVQNIHSQGSSGGRGANSRAHSRANSRANSRAHVRENLVRVKGINTRVKNLQAFPEDPRCRACSAPLSGVFSQYHGGIRSTLRRWYSQQLRRYSFAVPCGGTRSTLRRPQHGVLAALCGGIRSTLRRYQHRRYSQPCGGIRSNFKA